MSVEQEKGTCLHMLTCEYVSDSNLLKYRMHRTCHCGCMGRRCHYWRMEKMPGVSLASHLERVETLIHERLEGIPNDCLRFGHNQALFFLLTLLGDPLWRYRVRELHPKTRLFSFFRVLLVRL